MFSTSMKFVVAVVGSLVGLGAVIFGAWELTRRRRRRGNEDEADIVMMDEEEDNEGSDIEDSDARLAAYRGRGRAGTLQEDEPGPEFINQASHVLSLPSLKKRVLVLGLDGAGKTTLLSHLTGQPRQLVYEPTAGVKMVDMATRNCTFNMWEVGGGNDMRAHWEKFLDNVEQLLFVVDGCSPDDRLLLARSELERVMKDSRLDGVPLLLVITHQDRLEAKSPDEIAHRLKLHRYNASRHVCQAVGVSMHFDQPPEGLAKLRSWLFPVMAHALQVQDDIEEARHHHGKH